MDPPPLPPRPPPAVLAPPPIPPRVVSPASPTAPAGWPLPPRPPIPVGIHSDAYPEKGFAPRRSRKWRWVAIGVGVLVLVVIVASLCGALINRDGQNQGAGKSSGTSDHGGHPLSVADGGPDIGAPGSIPVFGKRSTDHFVLTTDRSSFVTRLDPIVTPGSVGTHLHRVHGASYLTPNLLRARELQRLANCSTATVQDDKSLYWCPTIHHRFPNGSMISLPLIRTSLYYLPKAPTGVPLYPFPDNYNLVVGDPNRRVYNQSDWYAPGMFYQCYRGGGQDLVTSEFPDSPCRDGLVLIVTFCWDGVYAENGDYSKHVAVPTDGINGYFCPPQFPKKFITLRFETTFATSQYPYQGKGKTWVLANGDATGLGIHGDFVNGWKESTLKDVLENCRYMNGTAEVPVPEDPRNCPALNATVDAEMTRTCRGQTPIVNESVGESVPIPYLPGCNSIWSGTGPRAAQAPSRRARQVESHKGSCRWCTPRSGATMRAMWMSLMAFEAVQEARAASGEEKASL